MRKVKRTISLFDAVISFCVFVPADSPSNHRGEHAAYGHGGCECGRSVLP